MDMVMGTGTVTVTRVSHKDKDDSLMTQRVTDPSNGLDCFLFHPSNLSMIRVKLLTCSQKHF